ncbi:MAG: exo-alpha-sialidase [Candidatus Aminicenantes bacterium]|nr:exo-alpha-sialidase [Candidatus Aminicenantes bacterium]
MKIFTRFLGLFIIFFILISCDKGDGTTDGDGSGTNPVPVLASISPAFRVQHSPTFTLTASGSGFVSSSKIVFNGTEMETTFVSANVLTCELEPDDIIESTTARTADPGNIDVQCEDVSVFVRSLAPGGGDSSPLNFTIRTNHSFEILNDWWDEEAEIATDTQGKIYIAARDDEQQGSTWYERVYVRHSSDHGDNFTKIKASNTTGDVYRPVIATTFHISFDSSGSTSSQADDDPVYIAWFDDSQYGDKKCEVYFSQSTDGGQTWSAEQNISNSGGKVKYNLGPPDLTVDGNGTIYCIWTDSRNNDKSEIFFTKTTSSSQPEAQAFTWSTPKKISIESSPRIFVDGNGCLYVVSDAYVSGNRDIHFVYSTDQGNTWSIPQKLSGGVSGDSSQDPDIAVDSEGTIHIVWKLFISANQNEIYYIKSTSGVSAQNAGMSWETPVNLSQTGSVSYDPRITVDSADNLNILWAEWAGDDNEDLYYIRSIDYGLNWTTMMSILDYYVDYPAMAVDRDGNINIVCGRYATNFIRSTRWE